MTFALTQLAGFGAASDALASGTTGTYGTGASAQRDIGSSATSGGLQWTAPSTGILKSVKMNVGVNTGSATLTAYLYSNNAGNPGSLLSTGSAQAISGTGEVNWTFSDPAISASTVHWIVWTRTSGAGIPEFDTVANDASYGSGRNNTPTSITTTGLPNTEDWRCQIVYQY